LHLVVRIGVDRRFGILRGPGEPLDLHAVHPFERPALQLAADAPAGHVPGRVGFRIDETAGAVLLVGQAQRELARRDHLGAVGDGHASSGGDTPSASGLGALYLRGCDATGRYAAAVRVFGSHRTTSGSPSTSSFTTPAFSSSSTGYVRAVLPVQTPST